MAAIPHAYTQIYWWILGHYCPEIAQGFLDSCITIKLACCFHGNPLVYTVQERRKTKYLLCRMSTKFLARTEVMPEWILYCVAQP